jgi:NTE family protein
MRTIVLFVALILFAPAAGLINVAGASAQNIATTDTTDSAFTASKARPTIGLALSGGGARGLAHIGALRVIEDLGIPIDYIAGTSMGSVIGALYAAGLSPDEIEAAMLEMNWVDIFSDRPHRSEQSFRRKQDDRSDYLDFEVGLKHLKPVLPKGLIAGQKLTLAIKVPELYTSIEQDFDDLPIPFRAVATDIETGEMVVLHSGSLVHAIRASISVPGIFAPVSLQGRYLVDGGIARNLPVDVVKEMGADIVIAIDVGRPVDEITVEEIRSVLDVTRQTSHIYTQQTSQGVLQLADVLLRLRLEGFSTVDYEKTEEIVIEGEAASKIYVDMLSALSVTDDEYREFLARQRHGKVEPWRIDAIELDNGSRVNDSVLERRISIQPGDMLDLRRLEYDLGRIYELGLFGVVDFELDEREEGNVLTVLTSEKYYAPNIVNFGMDLVDDLEGRSRFCFLVRYTRLEMNRFGGEWRTDFRLGQSREVRSEWFQPLEPTRTLFVAPFVRACYDVQDIYNEGTRTAEYLSRGLTAGVDLGIQIWRFGEVRAGIFTSSVDRRFQAGCGDLPTGERERAGFTAEVLFDTLDDPDYPASGSAAWVRLYSARSDIGGEDDYDKLEGDVARFFSIGRNTGFLTFSGGSSLETDLPYDEQFLFGGPQSFSGLRYGEERGEFFGVARIGYYRQIMEGMPMLGTALYLGGWFEAGNIWMDQDDASIDDLRYAGSIVLGAKSVIGPIQVGIGYNDDEDSSIFLTIGRQFGSFKR